MELVNFGEKCGLIFREIGLNQRASRSRRIQAFGRAAAPIEVAVQRDPMIAAALAGLGVMSQPLALVNDALPAGTLVRLLQEYNVPAPSITLLFAPDRCIKSKLRGFLDFFIDAFGKSRAT